VTSSCVVTVQYTELYDSRHNYIQILEFVCQREQTLLSKYSCVLADKNFTYYTNVTSLKLTRSTGLTTEHSIKPNPQSRDRYYNYHIPAGMLGQVD